MTLAVDAGILGGTVSVGTASEGAEATGARLVLRALGARQAGQHTPVLYAALAAGTLAGARAHS